MSYYMQLLQKRGIELSDDQKSARRAWGASLDPTFKEYSVDDLEDFEEVTTPLRNWTPPEHVAETAFSPEGLRVCSACRVAKEPHEFSKNKNKKDGLDARCKRCKSEKAKQYNKEKKNG